MLHAKHVTARVDAKRGDELLGDLAMTVGRRGGSNTLVNITCMYAGGNFPPCSGGALGLLMARTLTRSVPLPLPAPTRGKKAEEEGQAQAPSQASRKPSATVALFQEANSLCPQLFHSVPTPCWNAPFGLEHHFRLVFHVEQWNTVGTFLHEP